MIEYTRESGRNVVILEVPGIIECRDMVLRTVSAACKLVMPDARTQGSIYSTFTNQVISAVGEAYNNIVLHGYAGREPAPIELRIENCPRWMRIVIKDFGVSYDPAQANSPDLASLPESGLGVFIMRSFVDEVTYSAGTPNVLTLFKRLDETGEDGMNTRCVLGSERGR